jgi:hypothetical protein
MVWDSSPATPLDTSFSVKKEKSARVNEKSVDFLLTDVLYFFDFKID